MNRRTKPAFVRISIRVEIARAIKVKAYKRLRHGKIERVKGHYRRR